MNSTVAVHWKVPVQIFYGKYSWPSASQKTSSELSFAICQVTEVDLGSLAIPSSSPSLLYKHINRNHTGIEQSENDLKAYIQMSVE